MMGTIYSILLEINRRDNFCYLKSWLKKIHHNMEQHQQVAWQIKNAQRSRVEWRVVWRVVQRVWKTLSVQEDEQCRHRQNHLNSTAK